MTDEINRKLHEAMGKCWHGPFMYQRKYSEDFQSCEGCGILYGRAPLGGPDYAGSLDAVREVEMWVIEKVGRHTYGVELLVVIGREHTVLHRSVVPSDFAMAATATALQRATACVKALEGEGK